MEELKSQYVPEILEKRRKYTRYKGKVEFYKKIAIALFVLLTGMAFILGLTLKGNLALQQRLADSKTLNGGMK